MQWLLMLSSVVLLLLVGDLPFWTTALLLLAWKTSQEWRFLKTIKRDSIALCRGLQAMWTLKQFQRNNLTVPILFERSVQRNPDKACIIFEDRVWTFKQMSDLSNRVAHVFEDAGFKPGDTVALILDNRPEYVAIWLGLAKAGVVVALINYNLKGNPLCHSIQIVDSKAVVFGIDYTDALSEVLDQLDPSISLYAFDIGQRALPAWSKSLDEALADASTAPLGGKQRRNYNDKMLYIYTSGTTGLPKAVKVPHCRFAIFSSAVHYAIQMKTEDVIYITLPLYHSSGGMASIGQAIHFGCTAVLRKKFSASAFWAEASRHQVTVAVYIGEICRYLLSSPQVPEEKTHQVRIMFGNGMRPQIWPEFIKRFNVPLIAEAYAGTESVTNTMNYEGVVGAVGAMSVLFPSLNPVALIRVDAEGEPIRGPDGRCIRCKAGEPGMYVALFRQGHPLRDFHGYVDESASRKKVARDVFRRGDTAFLSGDILVMDELGYLYFKDRTGDTFRWRGENVSTTEVEAVVSNVAELKDCAVYGVEVPGSEGRAGMAAILDPDRSLDLVSLAQGLAKVLPLYARPLFIRTVSVIDLTGTYKLRKVDYQKEGFDLTKVKDDIYFMDPDSHRYLRWTEELYQDLLSGRLRV